MRKVSALFVLLIFFSLSLASQWLYIGPVPQAAPAVSGGEKGLDELVNTRISISPFSPEEGKEVELIPGRRFVWKVYNDRFSPGSTRGIYFFASYLFLNKWERVNLKFTSSNKFVVYLDGKLLDKSNKGNLKKKKLLEQGKHSILVELLYEPARDKEVNLKLIVDKGKISLKPCRPLSLREIMNLRRVRSILVSPLGEYAAIMLSKWNSNGKQESWVEIIRISDRKVVKSLRGMNVRNFRWRPHTSQYSYVTRKKEKGVIWLSGVDTDTRKLVEKKDLGSFVWSKDGKFLIYYTTEVKKEFDLYGLKRVKNPMDRQKGNREVYRVFQLFPETGFERPVAVTTAYPVSVNPSGNKLLLEDTIFDARRRPYSIPVFYLLDLNTLEMKKLIEDPWINRGIWSPDGKNILFLGGPSAFNGAGNILPRGRIPNEYDNQAYIYNLETGEVKAITRNFYPSINSAVWVPDGNIYFTAEDKTFVRLYKYDPEKGRIQEVPTGVEIVRGLNISENGLIAFIGTGVNYPHRAFVFKPGKSGPLLSYFPEEEEFSRIMWGKVEDWDVKVGKFTLKGRIYYPPGFTPEKKYPVIVYYYGGTSPVSRDFDGRYPKEWWAAKGYVVYVVVPVGSTGFGEEFSSCHVNDWGKVAGEQIIKATKKFMKSHPFAGKVGIIGASFGGFLTQYLLTKTDMYDCAVSHAGISLIPHYWGEGYWGYTYNAVSAAFSFPWNRKDIYVKRSPLFYADKIKTPLLLLHGTDDTNVPTGESDQMFTALKLLGKPVELIKVKGENHWVMGYKHRVGWYRAIIAWFDRWLKGDSTLWKEIFKEK